ncbi:hypothetical protein COCNU_05G005600 [Cocos nucifera]|uniref:Uncharacterized protein n=1 Tax=Cocos nucifera TaxID=13894 RepID=A0A8K0I901_COCNU|nr:hypothetical protein COCNU_05G005600 [Cocos nucifera]
MSVATTAASAQNISTFPRPDRFYPLPIRSYLVKIRPFSNSSSSPALLSQARRFGFVQMRTVPCQKASRWQVGGLLSGDSVDESPRRDVSGQLSLDELLSVAEVLCILPPAIYSIGCLVASLLPGVAKPFQVSSGNKFFVCQYFFFVGAVVIGNLVRWKQWQRMYRVNEKGVNVDLVQRIEKVEQDLRSSVKIAQVLSRQLEKLGIRFRLTRKALKDPISEKHKQGSKWSLKECHGFCILAVNVTSVILNKNSEATQALAVQEAVLERELGEIQKVLLAMQEILATLPQDYDDIVQLLCDSVPFDSGVT